MELKASKTLERIAAESLAKCVARLSRVSSYKWSVVGSGVASRSLREAVREHSAQMGRQGAAVHFTVTGGIPFASMVVFRPGDIDALCRGFLGVSFSRFSSFNQAQELLFSELANIIINSLASSLSNELKRPFIPSVPKCLIGEPPFLLEALWASLDQSARQTVATVLLDLKCGDAATRSEIVAVIPAELEAALAASQG